MRMQTVLQAMKVFFLFIFIVLDLFGMFHGLSATMPFFSYNVNVVAISIYGYSILLISVFCFFKLLNYVRKIDGLFKVVFMLLMRTTFTLFIVTILLSIGFVVVGCSSVYDILYLIFMAVFLLFLGVRSFVSRARVITPPDA